MADRKISDLTALTTPASGDYLPIVDISEASAANKNKRITIEELLRGAPDGTAGAPGFAFESDPDSGLYSTGANGVALSTGGTGRLFIDSSGRVGIGTTSPITTLHVDGTGAQYLRTSSSTYSNFVQTFAGNGSTGVEYKSVYRFVDTDNGERARIDSSGRLLVGTSTALAIGGENAAKLQLIDASATSAGWFNLARFANSAGANAIQFGKSRGTTVGDYTIVQNGDTLGSITFAGADGTDLGSYGAQIKAEVDGTPGTNDMPGRLVFSTTADGASSPTERLRIDSSGRVGIGTTASPAGASIKLTLDGSNGGGIELVAANDGGGALVPSAGGGVQFYTHTGAVGSESYSERARIDGAGRLLVGASTSRSGGLLQVETTGSGLSRVHSLVNNSNDVTAPVLKFTKTRGTTVGAVTAVQNGDDLAYIAFSGTDGTSVLDGAWISAIVDGTPGTNDLPTRLTFSTTANGASSPTERVRITSTGQVRLAGAGITFNGDTATANELDDYEEGTWTPSLGGTWTANPADLSGKYVKIGRAVYVAIYFAGGAKSTSTSGYFTGLPFLTNDPGTGQCVDSNVTDCGGALFSNNDRLWISGTSFAGFTQVTGVYFT
jgi:hypothetical protein